MILSGRTKIFTNYTEITDSNVGEILMQSYTTFLSNVSQIDYLYNYYKGVQPILNRTKLVRQDINNKIVENHAFNIVNFQTGYLLEKPIQYVARKDEVDNQSLISFNDFNEIENKESKDKEIANAQAICGTAYRLILPNENYIRDSQDESPFTIATIDPRQAFVVYSSDIGNKALLGVIVLTLKDEQGNTYVKLQAYTQDKYYVFNMGTMMLETIESHTKGNIPLIEYPYNEQRMGAFEPIIPILDAVNNLDSNAVDGVEQFIQSLLVFKNIEINKEMLQQLQELGAINISDSGEVKASIEYLSKELNQNQVQTLKESMLSVAYRIVGMPVLNRSGSVGNSMGSVIMRDGWSEVEARIQDVELSFKKSEKQFLKLALSFARTLTANRIKLSLADLEIKFSRRNYENKYQQAQTLDLLLKNDKVAPRLAFVVCGLFADPESAYDESEQHYQSVLAKADQFNENQSE